MEEYEDDVQEWIYEEFPHELDVDDAARSALRWALEQEGDADD